MSQVNECLTRQHGIYGVSGVCNYLTDVLNTHWFVYNCRLRALSFMTFPYLPENEGVPRKSVDPLRGMGEEKTKTKDRTTLTNSMAK